MRIRLEKDYYQISEGNEGAIESGDDDEEKPLTPGLAVSAPQRRGVRAGFAKAPRSPSSKVCCPLWLSVSLLLLNLVLDVFAK
jgi:hypothetical protein